MTTYDNEQRLLRLFGFYPKCHCHVTTVNGIRKESVVGLQVECAPILMRDKINRIQSLVGGGFNVTGYTNLGYIYITEKINKNVQPVQKETEAH